MALPLVPVSPETSDPWIAGAALAALALLADFWALAPVRADSGKATVEVRCGMDVALAELRNYGDTCLFFVLPLASHPHRYSGASFICFVT